MYNFKRNNNKNWCFESLCLCFINNQTQIPLKALLVIHSADNKLTVLCVFIRHILIVEKTSNYQNEMTVYMFIKDIFEKFLRILIEDERYLYSREVRIWKNHGGKKKSTKNWVNFRGKLKNKSAILRFMNQQYINNT